ncbi:Ig-like domain-containing protein [Myxococcus sp. CA033]|uniref:Ig-like domain-containing protein n=1 Tax=Myxococcus sp. CA033 TaxID=2741516 RepID=UPI00157B88B8|nr:Ig-like domain-containing protein [Myxococcus sp. CA033]NTX38789.1 Ig-like domain-containing protein [Myxococcus sp. CA033]
MTAVRVATESAATTRSSSPVVATGTYADSSTKDISSAVVWSSATSTVATVDPTGLLTSLAAGTSKITATLGTVTGSTEVTVIEVEVVSIAVAPGSPSIGAGATQAFTATATMTDNTTKDLTTLATWTSATPTSASIANTGIATGLAVGTSTITATFNGIEGSTLLTVTEATLVSIALLPANATIPVGMKQHYFATGTFSDESTEDLTETVAWSSGDPTIASSAVVGATRQYTATGEFTDGTFHDLTSVVTWASNNAAVAPISTSGSTPGVALAVSPGRATISAKSGGAMGSAVLTVTP